MQRWAGATDTAVSDRGWSINPMLDAGFLGHRPPSGTSRQGGSRFLARCRWSSTPSSDSGPSIDDRRRRSMPTLPDGNLQWMPPAWLDGLHARASSGRRGARPPAGGTVMAARSSSSGAPNRTLRPSARWTSSATTGSRTCWRAASIHARARSRSDEPRRGYVVPRAAARLAHFAGRTISRRGCRLARPGETTGGAVRRAHALQHPCAASARGRSTSVRIAVAQSAASCPARLGVEADRAGVIDIRAGPASAADDEGSPKDIASRLTLPPGLAVARKDEDVRALVERVDHGAGDLAMERHDSRADAECRRELLAGLAVIAVAYDIQLDIEIAQHGRVRG